MCPLPDDQHEGAVLTENRTDLQRPKLFRVLLHNDDYTTMDFVVFILKSIFQKSDADAVAITMKVHMEGFGIAGVYPHEIANAKAGKVVNLARARGFPLLATVEQD
jgi:ATP-dependent Clp protease adaptor protein ClpS